MLNKVILMGRLTRDPEMRSTQSGISVCSFSLAVDRNFAKQGEQKQADFFNIIAWRSTADFVSRYFRKGQLVAVSGSLQTRNWDDQEGKKHYVTEIVADDVYFAESKRDSAGAPADFGNEPSGNPYSGSNNGSDRNSGSGSNGGGFGGFSQTSGDDDLPF